MNRFFLMSTFLVMVSLGTLPGCDTRDDPQPSLKTAKAGPAQQNAQAWALALADRHIRVNALAMDATDTEMLRSLFEGENIGAWTGVPVELGPRKPPHRIITG